MISRGDNYVTIINSTAKINFISHRTIYIFIEHCFTGKDVNKNYGNE